MTKTLQAIEDYQERTQSSSHRNHLGASILGRECIREIFYTFRWVKSQRHTARMLRLFDRGNREEERFVNFLRQIGVQVWDTDQNGRQWKIVDVDGHFGGSLDGVALGLPDIPEDPALLEFKTHNDKSFQKLIACGVKEAKPEHYSQMQVYMKKMDLKFGLYMAVNKNTDEIWTEVVPYDDAHASNMLNLAERLVKEEILPPGISDQPGWYKCKFCTFQNVCHYGELPEVNCRTCAHATPAENGLWRCENSKSGVDLMDSAMQANGCERHIFHPMLMHKAQMVGSDGRADYVEYILLDGRQIKNGYDYTRSKDLCNQDGTNETP